MTDPERVVAYNLNARQAALMDAIWVDGVMQALFGGAAGGAKSHALRAIAFHCAHQWPGARIAIFRDNYTMLRKTQVIEWFKEMTALGFDIKEHWRETLAEWQFANGSIVEFLHLDQSIGAEKWLSAEWAVILPDEATQIGAADHATLYSRVRVPSCKECRDDPSGFCARHSGPRAEPLEMQQRWLKAANDREAEARAAGVTDAKQIARVRSDWRPLAVYASNPGGASHDYFKSEFVDVSRKNDGRPWEIKTKIIIPGLGEQEVVTKRAFIQSFLSDNPHIDPLQYAATLAHLPERRRAQLLSGNWDYFEGKVFDMLDESVHLVDARNVFSGKLAPPADWPRLGGFDHGTTSPSAAEWMTRDEDGFFILGYLEYYAAGPNSQHIEAMRQLLALDGRYDLTFMADPTMYYKRQGHTRLWSVADEFMFGGEPPEDAYEAAMARNRGIRLKQSDAQRIPSRMVMERLLDPNPDLVFPSWHPRAGEHGAPRMFICKQAPNLWREIQNLRYLEGSEDTVKENDHAYDAAYRVATVFERALYSAHRTGKPVLTIGYAR